MNNANLASLSALIEEYNWIGSLANISAQVLVDMPNINWVGFYLWDGKLLRLGPFAGKPACTQIALGKGVCGVAAKTGQTQIVADVDQFPGHIVCDAASKSEIVVPLFKGGRLVGVWDVDSPVLNRFGKAEQEFFEKMAFEICARLFHDEELRAFTPKLDPT